MIYIVMKTEASYSLIYLKTAYCMHSRGPQLAGIMALLTNQFLGAEKYISY